MAVRPSEPQQGNNAAAAALLVLAGVLAGPVLAAPDHDLLCDEGFDAVPDVSQQELTVIPVNAGDEQLDHQLLKSRVEQAAREVFASDEEELANDADDAGLDDPAPVIQGLSDSERLPLKRQMYRRDI